MELGEFVDLSAPVKCPCIDDNSTEGCTMTTDPFGCRMENNVCSVINWSAEVTGTPKCIIDLESRLVWCEFAKRVIGGY